ncbi:hypothetical protein [Atribacter laminatus]|nr:hypothetical protein [Atribacter laminatus]
MYCAHSLINVATCHGMSNLCFRPHLVLVISMTVYPITTVMVDG